jgi:hypothetical protein
MTELTLSGSELVARLKQPGHVFVFAKLTQHDKHAVRVVKSLLRAKIAEMTSVNPDLTFECLENKSGLYVGSQLTERE